MREVDEKDGSGVRCAAGFGFIAENPVTPTWYIYRDSNPANADGPVERELIPSDDPDWQYFWGGNRQAPGGEETNNSVSIHRTGGAGYTLDENGWLELVLDDGVKTASAMLRMNVVEAS